MTTDDTKAQYYALMQQKQESGFEDVPEPIKVYNNSYCIGMSHFPPSHLHVPYGKRYRHVCAECGTITYVNSNEVMC